MIWTQLAELFGRRLSDAEKTQLQQERLRKQKEKARLKQRARAIPIYTVGEIPAHRLVDSDDIPSGSSEVLKLFFRSWPFIRPYFLGYWSYPERVVEAASTDMLGERKAAYLLRAAVGVLLLGFTLIGFDALIPDVPTAEGLLYVLFGLSIVAIAGTWFGRGTTQLLSAVVLTISLVLEFIVTSFFTSGWYGKLAIWAYIALCLPWPYIQPYIRRFFGNVRRGVETSIADLVSDGEFNFAYCALLAIVLTVVTPAFGLIPPIVTLAAWLFYVPVIGVVVALCAMAMMSGVKQLIATIALIFALLGVAISATFFVTGWEAKVIAGVLVAICIAGWTVQFRANEDKSVSYRVRVKTHLAYFYIVSFVQRILGTGFALLNADLLNQALLQGEPLAPLLSSLLGFPELSSDFLASLSQEERMDLLWRWVAINLGYFFMMLPINVAMGYYNMWIMQMINQDLREALVERWHQLSITYHSDHRTGDSIFRIYQDSAMVTNVIRMLIEITLRIFSYISTVAVIFLLSPLIGTVAALIVIPGFIFGYFSMPRVRQRSLAYRAAASDVTATVQETFSSIRVIKAFNAADQAQDKMEQDSVVSFNAAYRIRNLIAAVTIGMFTLMAAVMITGEFTMAFWARDALPTFGEEIIKLVGLTFVVWNLAAFNYARGEFRGSANSLRWLLRNWMTCQDMAMGLKRVFDILDIEPDIQDKPDAVPFESFTSDISFENVNFRYVEDRPVLDDVSFEAKTGTITAIIGPTGSGKSSLMALLLRMFDPDGGRITIDGRDIKDYQVNSLRSAISIALQENVLFALSVRDNIKYVAPSATDEQLHEAIRVAAMDDYVDGLPEGVDTILSDRGGKISSGQKQRLSIARAVIRDAPILVLDEPTAALDAATELKVLSNLAEWGKDRAIFLITHRISTIRRADNILYLDKGRIVESGNHEELMALEDGAYRSFVEAEMTLTDTSRSLIS
ncbi:MAG: ABC transporter ATP-binding protein [Gammaproteobacteria bacterium]|nr:ABC transporter ATP-binding protein [Gammaproteobacteria bacterium]